MSCASAVLAHKKTMAIDDASRRMIELSGWTPGDRVKPNGSRLSCGRLARRRKGEGRQSVPRQGHNTPVPLERSPPASFKRLLGGLGCAIEKVHNARPQTVLGTDDQQSVAFNEAFEKG